MNILSTQALRGPNYWSADHHRLIQIRLDISDGASITPALWTQWSAQFPALAAPMDDVAALPVTAHIALALQRAAGAEVSAWFIKPTRVEHIAMLLVEYSLELTGKLAVEHAVELARALVRGEMPDPAPALAAVRESMDRERPSPHLQRMLNEARSRHLPVIPADEEDHLPYRVGYGKRGIDCVEDALPDMPFQSHRMKDLSLRSVTSSMSRLS